MSNAPHFDIDVSAFWADPYPDLAQMRREAHLNALLLAEDVVAPGEDGRSQLRHERDRRLPPHPRQRG